MSTTSQPTSFVDLYLDLQNRVRLTTGVTATENQAKRYINIALQDMHLGFDYRFPWAERSAVLVTQPKYTTGTLSVSQGGTTLTGVGTLWNTANSFSVNNMRVGGKIRIGGGDNIYTISAVASDTSATISSMFIPSDVSGGSYEYFEDEYALASDFLRPIDQRSFADELDIPIIGRREFRRRYVRNNILQTPNTCTIFDKPPSGNTTLVRKVVFSPAPSEAMMIPYSYVTANLVVASDGTLKTGFTLDADEPVIPLRYRHAIVYHALYNWYRDKKDDTRSVEAKNEYADIMIRTASDTEIGEDRPSIRPRSSIYRARARAPYTETGRFDIGNRFDRLK